MNKINAKSEILRFKKLSEKAIIPKRGSSNAAGYDLHSAAEIIVPKQGKTLVPTNLSCAIPDGSYGRIAPRSGLASKNFIDVGAGVIDSDYRGEKVDFKISEGDRIAQLIIEYVVPTEVIEVKDLDETMRGEGGFGSTGVRDNSVIDVTEEVRKENSVEDSNNLLGQKRIRE